MAVDYGYIIPRLQANPQATAEGKQVIIASQNWYKILLDPLFWQALGKGMRWNRDEKAIEQLERDIKFENVYYENAKAYPTETEQFYQALDRTREKIQTMYSRLEAHKGNLIWKDHWNRFIEYLASGKSAEEFFNQLLK